MIRPARGDGVGLSVAGLRGPCLPVRSALEYRIAAVPLARLGPGEFGPACWRGAGDLPSGDWLR